jgi:hypothetical protein
MAFSVSHPFRALFHKTTGKHAAPKGAMPAPRQSSDGAPHRPAHAASMHRETPARRDAD